MHRVPVSSRDCSHSIATACCAHPGVPSLNLLLAVKLTRKRNSSRSSKSECCLANSYKPPSSRCIAGIEIKDDGTKGDWVRPISAKPCAGLTYTDFYRESVNPVAASLNQLLDEALSAYA